VWMAKSPGRSLTRCIDMRKSFVVQSWLMECKSSAIDEGKTMLRTNKYRGICATLLIVYCVAGGRAMAQSKPMSHDDRGKSKEMLEAFRDDVRMFYFDKKYQGVDLDARFKSVEQKIDTAPSLAYAVSYIAATVDVLNDSHTFFIPPPLPYTYSYGWEMKAIGDSECFVTAVRPGSDAANKGLKPGDQVLGVNGYRVSRQDMGTIKFLFNTLRPQSSLQLIVRSPEGVTRQIDAKASMLPNEQTQESDFFSFAQKARDAESRHNAHFVEYGNDAIVWKLPDFVYKIAQADKMLDQIRAYKAVILDLRGNSGGSMDFLAHFLGGMFDHEIKIADRITRDGTKRQVAKSRGAKTFNGKVVVLIDSESASVPEIFARVMQLEKRGTVVGDLSPGKVMESQLHPHSIGVTTVTYYSAAITEADFIMTDGKSLEHVGVMPDVRINPAPSDIVAGRDPVLAHAASLVGLKLTPEEAGKLFPVEWPGVKAESSK
jgi:C-terminal processing protease CtpA/Prc